MFAVIVNERAIDVPAWNDGCDERRSSSRSEASLYPRNQGSSRGFRLGSITTVGMPIRPG